MIVLGIDPGPVKSGYCRWDWSQRIVLQSGEMHNDSLLQLIAGCDLVTIEMIRNYGMIVGRPIYETLVWIGMMLHSAMDKEKSVDLVERPVIQNHFCQSSKAKTGNITKVIMDRYGGKGTKKNPGPFYGVSGSHAWDATAIAIWTCETEGRLLHPFVLRLLGEEVDIDDGV